MTEYTFRSAKGGDEIIITAIGEDEARSEAMFLLWGPPSGWCQNRGTGLHLVRAQASHT